jgi:hypothetical protein
MKMMKVSLKIMTLTLIMQFIWAQLPAQNQYNDFKTMSQKINKLGTDYPALCSVKSLVQTSGGKDIWLLTIGTGEKDKKPGIVIFGGVEGNNLLGKEIAFGFAENLLKESANSEIKNLINSITFYVFPDVSPDATEQFFAKIKYERTVNTRQTDDDRDFLIDEDPYEDLNNDGFITQIRVSDPTGTYIESEDDKRIMVPADLSKGQLGTYLLYSEGVDNDKDGNFNEDGEGGVNFNKNFSFNYEEFGTNAGLHPMSEVETKAVADFLFDHFNIYATFTFGPQDNLGQPMKAAERQGAVQSSGISQSEGQGQGQELGMRMFMGAGRGTGSGRPQSQERADRRITSIMRTDETINKLVSDKYHEITGIKGAPNTRNSPGNFMEWAYFHYGRYSFSTPGWWIGPDRGKNAEAAFLKYARDNKLKEVFVPWTEIQHSDFPGKKVEVGGIKPFALTNPPADTLGYIISRNYKFLTTIAAMHPELEYLDPKVENTGENIFRITLKVHNKGVFATCAEIGDINQWTRIMRIAVEPGSGQSLVSGQKVQRMQRLEGDKSAEFSWLIRGKGSVKINAGALNVGTITTSLELK